MTAASAGQGRAGRAGARWRVAQRYQNPVMSSSTGPVGPQPGPLAAAQDLHPEEAEQGGQQGQRRQHGERHGDRGRHGDAVEERQSEGELAEQCDAHGDAGEEHRPPGGVDRVDRGVLDAAVRP